MSSPISASGPTGVSRNHGAALSPLFQSYATERLEGEHFGDYVIRAGIVQATTAGLNFHENLSAEVGN